MEPVVFVPFKPVETVTFVEKPVTTSIASSSALSGAKDRVHLQNKPKLLKGSHLSKHAFVKKYNLEELKTDRTDQAMSYYFDRRSNTVYEINDLGPVVFMKSDPTTVSKLIVLNEEILGQ